MTHIKIKCTLIFFAIALVMGAQADTIGLGWAKNSINAPIFRKSSIASFGGVQYASFYDSLGYVNIAKRDLGTHNWETIQTQHKTANKNDAHRNISIGVDGNGYLHMAWDHHGNPLNYCMSTDSGMATMGNKISMTGTLERNVTYPEFYRMANGNLIFMYRDGSSGSGNLVICNYDINTKQWTRLHNVLIDGEGSRNAYWQAFVDANGTIHVSWVWRETWDVSTNHDMCYAKSTDGGETWVKSTGEQYTIPITAASSEYTVEIAQKSELMNQTSMYATSDGTPYIASYWEDDVTKSPQYQLIYLDNDSLWQKKTISDRLGTFSLSGGGTKKIPISRPQILVDENGEKPIVYLIYRDSERDYKASINVCKNIEADTTEWLIYDLTDFPVYYWEPSFDMDLWRDSAILNVFIQKMDQGDGETLGSMNLPAQPVIVWEFSTDGVANDTIKTPAIIAGLATEPSPIDRAKEIGLDTVLRWIPGENATSHLVYMGPSASNMELLGEVLADSIEVTGLEYNSFYFWRVDEKTGERVTKGKNWLFFTKTIVGTSQLQKIQNELKIYPHPVNEILYIENIIDGTQIDIFNLEGKKVTTQEYHKGLQATNLTSGMYIIKIKGKNPVQFLKQ